MLELIFELILELLAEGAFALVRRYVKNKFLRGVLYVLVVLVIAGVALGVGILAFAVCAAMLDTVLDILAKFLSKLN